MLGWSPDGNAYVAARILNLNRSHSREPGSCSAPADPVSCSGRPQKLKKSLSPFQSAARTAAYGSIPPHKGPGMRPEKGFPQSCRCGAQVSAAACPAPTLPAVPALPRSAAAATNVRTTRRRNWHRYVPSPAAGRSRPRKSESPDPPRKVREAHMRRRSWLSMRGAAPAMHRVAPATRRAAARDTRATASSDRRAEALHRPEAYSEVRCS